MSIEELDRRSLLKTSGAVTAGAAIAAPQFGGVAHERAPAAGAKRVVEPFALNQVWLAPSIFTQKRDYMLNYLRARV